MAQVIAIAAIGKNRVLGKGNRLLWHIPDDLKRFKKLTEGHPIILGRKTFESIVGYLGSPLPNRTNIVVTRDPTYKGPTFVKSGDNFVVVASVEEALKKAADIDQNVISIGGGAQIYEAALLYTDKLCLTLIDDEKEGDAFFPAYEHLFTKKVFEEEREWNGLNYRWVDLER